MLKIIFKSFWSSDPVTSVLGSDDTEYIEPVPDLRPKIIKKLWPQQHNIAQTKDINFTV
jgi:hypothetical protein